MKSASSRLAAPIRVLVICLAIPVLALLFTLQNTATVAAQTGTIVDSGITMDTTWTAEGSPYLVTTRAFGVFDGATLTIEPGVEVVITAEGENFTVEEGTLEADGTAEDPILITSEVEEPGAWTGILVLGSATLNYVTVEYGGDFCDAGWSCDANLTIRGQATIANSHFRSSVGDGIRLEEDVDTGIQITDSSFTDNGRYPLFFTDLDDLLTSTVHAPQASGNGVDAIGIGEHATNFEYATIIAEARTLAPLGLPYVMDSELLVEPGGHLTVQPGVELQFAPVSSFTVEGTLTAMGTASAPITFTGTTQEPGAWTGLTVYKEDALPTATLDHVTIEYGNTANLRAFGVVTITDSLIRHAAGHGIYTGVSGQPEGSVAVTDTHIAGNGGYPIRLGLHSQGSPLILHNLSVDGNGTEAILIANNSLNGKRTLWNLGLPYVTPAEFNSLSVDDATLTVEPGVEVRFRKDQQLNVSDSGALLAVGEPTRPITFTGTTAEPGWWRGIRGVGILLLKQCNVGYGGSTDGSNTGMIIVGNHAQIENCHVHHSAGDGIHVRVWATAVVRNNRIEQNLFGLRNVRSFVIDQPVVDARHNWWGHSSGPAHASNPDGQGNPVSDLVLFDPWLTTTDGSGSGAQGDLRVQVLGSSTFFPGYTAGYAARYTNFSDEIVEDGLLVVTLPAHADYVDNSGGGVYWPQRHQLFWELGDLPPDSSELLSLQVQYYPGTRIGARDALFAQLAGSNTPLANLNTQPYYDYLDTTVTAQETLSEADVQAERQQVPALAQLYDQTVAEGFHYGAARRLTLLRGDPMTQVIMLRPDDTGPTVIYLQRQGDQVIAIEIDRSSLRVRTARGALTFDVQTGAWQKPPAATARGTDDDIDWGDCMINCIAEQFPTYLASKLFKSVSAVTTAVTCVQTVEGDGLAIANCANDILLKVPGWGEGVAIGQCNSDCSSCNGSCDDARCHCCTSDKRACEYGGLYGFFDIDSITTYQCDTETGRYEAGKTTQICALNEKCIPGSSGPTCLDACYLPAGGRSTPFLPFPATETATPIQSQPSTPTEISLVAGATDGRCTNCANPGGDHCANCDQEETTLRISLAGDADGRETPTGKDGPRGDLVPGQWLTYTITIRNSADQAVDGVLVTDDLGEHVDVDTLTLSDEGAYLPGSNEIVWWLDTLAPAGQPGATAVVSFTVRLRSDLPAGTVIANQATIQAAGAAPLTDAVVNVAQSLAAVPRTFIGESGQPLAIELAGRSPASESLSYELVADPIYGTLSGTPPALQYTPDPGFAGTDHLRYTVSNGTETSRPATVELVVEPSPSDTTLPQVLWTVPDDGADAVAVSSDPRFGGEDGLLYAPAIQVRFSERISTTTLTTATVQLTDEEGQPVPLSVRFDQLLNEALILPRQALAPNSNYTVTITDAVTDVQGNPLQNDYIWHFHTSAAPAATDTELYLPSLWR